MTPDAYVWLGGAIGCMLAGLCIFAEAIKSETGRGALVAYGLLLVSLYLAIEAGVKSVGT